MNRIDRLRRLIQDTRGATVIEYALICGLIVLVMVVGFQGFGTATRNTWQTVSSQMQNANNGTAA
jgi:pilus assembly protein Flp/PilA